MIQRFAQSQAIVEAVRFDGSEAAALEIARWAGPVVSLAIKDGAVALTLARRAVNAPCWLVKKGQRIRTAPEDVFDKAYVALGGIAVPHETATAPTPMAARVPAGKTEFFEGDFVHWSKDERKDEWEVFEADGNMVLIDGPWGQHTVNSGELTLLRRAA